MIADIHGDGDTLYAEAFCHVGSFVYQIVICQDVLFETK